MFKKKEGIEKKCILQFPRTQSDVFKLLVFSTQLSKTFGIGEQKVLKFKQLEPTNLLTLKLAFLISYYLLSLIKAVGELF